MIHFILNNQDIQTDLPASTVLLDFIRHHKNLKGTKIGCREGDCGACMVVVGEVKGDTLDYRTYTSCLTPLANVKGKHVLTIEGVNMQDLNPIQEAFHSESATQCGFCTPGFVMSLIGVVLNKKLTDSKASTAAMAGNICRCTGYKSIERAGVKVNDLLKERKDTDAVAYAVENKILPSYLSTIHTRLFKISSISNGQVSSPGFSKVFMGGGTDLYVRNHEGISENVQYLFDQTSLKHIDLVDNKLFIGGAATVTDLESSPLFNALFPDFRHYVSLVSSVPIRNMATLAGNFINASPIGDFTIFFMALNTTIILSDGAKKREVLLNELYLGYKKLNKYESEFIEAFWFKIPATDSKFHFEKVSKRTHLDIASVNSAIYLLMKDGVIADASITAGGVAPVPKFLSKTSTYLVGKKGTYLLLPVVQEIAQSEITPISDARGTETYKRLLLKQLIHAHFIKLFPEEFNN